MTVELDDAVARNLAAAAELVTELNKNSATRGDFLRLVKKAKPNVSIPEIDAAAPIEARIGELTKTIDELKTGLLQKEQDQSLGAARRVLTETRGYTEDGIKELEKFMLETNTADHLVAADALEKRKPAAKPMRPQFEVRGFFDTDEQDDKAWVENPERALDKELNKAFEAIANGLA